MQSNYCYYTAYHFIGSIVLLLDSVENQTIYSSKQFYADSKLIALYLFVRLFFSAQKIFDQQN